MKLYDQLMYCQDVFQAYALCPKNVQVRKTNRGNPFPPPYRSKRFENYKKLQELL